MSKLTFCELYLSEVAKSLLTALEAGHDVATAVRRKVAAGAFELPLRRKKTEKSFLHAVQEHCPEATGVVCKELYALRPETFVRLAVNYLKERCLMAKSNLNELLKAMYDIDADVLQKVFEETLSTDSSWPFWVLDSDGVPEYLSKYKQCLDKVVARAFPEDSSPLADQVASGDHSRPFIALCRVVTPGVRKELLRRYAFTAATHSTFHCEEFRELLGELTSEEVDDFLVFHPLVTKRDRRTGDEGKVEGAHKRILDFLRTCVSEDAFRVLLGSRLVHGLVSADGLQFVDTVEKHFSSYWPYVLNGQQNFLGALLTSRQNFPRGESLVFRKLQSLAPDDLEKALMAGADSDVPIAFLQIIAQMERSVAERYCDNSGDASMVTENLEFMKKGKSNILRTGRLEPIDLSSASKEENLTWRELFDLFVSLHVKTPGGVQRLLRDMHCEQWTDRVSTNAAADIVAVAIENDAVDDFLFKGHSEELAAKLGFRVFKVVGTVFSEAGLPGKALIEKWMRRLCPDGRSVLHVGASSNLMSWTSDNFLRYLNTFGNKLIRELCLTPFVGKTLSLREYAPPLFYLRKAQLHWNKFLSRLNDAEMIVDIYKQQDQWGRTQLLQRSQHGTWVLLKHLYALTYRSKAEELKEILTYSEPHSNRNIFNVIEAAHFEATYKLVDHVCGEGKAKQMLLSSTKVWEMGEEELEGIIALPQNSHLGWGWKVVKFLRAVSGSILFDQPGYPGVVQCLKRVLSEEELRSLLLRTTPKGETFLHVLGKSCGGMYRSTVRDYEVPEGLKLLPKEVLASQLLKPDPTDDGALFLHQTGASSIYVDYMLKEVPDVLQFSILARNDKGETVVHRLVREARALVAEDSDGNKYAAENKLKQAIKMIEVAEKLNLAKNLETAVDCNGNVFTRKDLKKKGFLSQTATSLLVAATS